MAKRSGAAGEKKKQGKLDRLVREHLHLVYREAALVMRRRGGDGCEWDDLVQEGALGLMQALDGWDGKRPLENYARMRVRGAMLDSLRDYNKTRYKQIRKIIPLEDIPEPTDGVPLPPADAERRELIPLLKRGLSRTQRIIFDAYFIEGIFQREIAAIVGRSQSNVARVIDAMVQRWRHILGTDGRRKK